MTEPSQPQETVVAEPAWVWTLVWVGFPLLGAAAALGLVAIADWVVSLPWAPLQGPFRLIDSWSGRPLTIGAAVVGVLVGLVFAAVGWGERLTVTVSDHRATLSRDREHQAIDRAAVTEVFLDGKDLVLLDRRTAELARERCDLNSDQLCPAFVAHGYRWVDADPYADAFRPWVDGADGLPPGTNAVLKARDRDLDAGRKKEAAELRGELARMGVVVRDRGKRQYWRPTER